MRERVQRLQADLIEAHGRDGVFIAAVEGLSLTDEGTIPVKRTPHPLSRSTPNGSVIAL